jgi:UDP-glucose 4-epimerase
MSERQWHGRHVTVLGGAGFIGSNLAIRLAQYGAKVTVVDGLIPGCGGHLANLEPVANGIAFVQADLSSLPVPDSVITAEVVFDLLGDPAHGRSVADPLRDLRHNLTAQVAVLEAIRRSPHRPRVVLASTRSVYGRPQRLPVDETHPIAPPDPNGIHKYAVEQYTLLYGRLYAVPVVRLRLTNTYGARQGNADTAHGVSGYLLGRLLRKEPVLLYGGGTFCRDWLAVEDAVDALVAAGSRPDLAGQVINIGHDQPRSLLDFARTAQEILGYGEILNAPLPEDQSRIDVGDYWTDPACAAERLGWRASTSLRDGLVRTLDFYLATPRGARWPPA